MKYKFIKNEADIIINTLETLLDKKHLIMRDVSEKAKELTVSELTKRSGDLSDPADLLAWVNDNYNIKDRENKSMRTIEIYNHFFQKNIEIKKQSKLLKELHKQAKSALNSKGTSPTFILGMKDYLNKKIKNTFSQIEFEEYADELTAEFLTLIENKNIAIKTETIVEFEEAIKESGIAKRVKKDIERIKNSFLSSDDFLYRECQFEVQPLEEIMHFFNKYNMKLNSDITILYCTNYQKQKIYYSVHASNLYSTGTKNYITKEIDDLYKKRIVLSKETGLISACLSEIKKSINSKFEDGTQTWKPLYLEEGLAKQFRTVPEKFSNPNVRIDKFSLSFFNDFNLVLELAVKSGSSTFDLDESYARSIFNTKLKGFVQYIDELLEENSAYEICEVVPILKTILNRFDFVDKEVIDKIKNEQLKKIISFNLKLNEF